MKNNKRKIKLIIILFLLLVTTGCTKTLTDSNKKAVKNEATGQWEKVTAYKHALKGTPLGHGATSMFYASEFFNLSTEAALAIRWHMGEYNVANNEMNELHKANSSYPLCYLLQFADRLSCVDYEHLESVPELND